MIAVLRLLLVALLLPVALAALGWTAFTPRRSASRARAVATQQLPLVLDPGERVEATMEASRREAWRYFHPTAGILAATDRRLLWIGVVPRGMIEWSGAEPPIIETASWMHDSVVIAPTRLLIGGRGLAIRAGPGAPATRLAVRGDPGAERPAVLTVAERRQAALREQAERERLAQERAAWLARQPAYHTVAPGEALISIAAQYGLSPESLQALNGLPTSRIRSGQRLLVKPGEPDPPGFVPPPQ